MKKLAFSVWPDMPGNLPCPESLLERSKSTQELLRTGGFEFRHISQCDQDEFVCGLVERYPARNKRKAASISDYVRIFEIIRALEAGYDEVLYLDYDCHLWSLPSGYGVAIQAHFQTEGSDEIVKLWYRGINSLYYVNQSHLEIMKHHLGLLQKDITRTNFSPKYTYPMNHLYRIENEVGYIPGFWHFGSFTDPDFCREDYIEDICHLSVVLGDNKPDCLLEGVNMNGSCQDSEYELAKLQSTFEKIRDRLANSFPRRNIEDIRADLQGVRIRPNYGNLTKRQQLKDFLLGDY